MRGIRGRLSYANVASTLALVVALGTGSAFAAGQLARRSVGAPQLRPGAVTADKIRKKAVTSPKIEALAVKQGKIANQAVTAAKLAQGAVTEAGIADNAVIPAKIPDDSLTGQKVNESTLAQVPSARVANVATTAEVANPEAFARVDGEGAVFPSTSRGIGTGDVRQGPQPGIYCINVPGFSPRGAQATPEYLGSNNISVFVRLGGTESCPAPQAEVRTYSAGTPQKTPFFIVFYR